MTATERDEIGRLIERLDNTIQRLEEWHKEMRDFCAESRADRTALHQDLLEIRTQFNLCQAEKVQRLAGGLSWSERWRGLGFTLMQWLIVLAAAAIFAHLYMPRK